jgi:hypothetical protein
MESPSTVFAHVTSQEELLLTSMPPVNLLITGGLGAIRNLLGSLLRNVDGPILAWYPGEHLVLPRHPRTGTMILHEVGLMTYGDQLQLLTWLETRARRIQIVSTTSTPLIPMVDAGAFNDTLYYRLNTMHVDVNE